MTRNRLLGNHAAHLESVRCKGWAFNKALAVCSQKVIAIFFLKSSSQGNSIWVIHYSAWKFARDSQEVSAAVAWCWWNVKDFDNVWGCPEIGWCENVTKCWLPVAVQQLRERFTQAVEEKHYSLCSYFMRRCCTEASGLCESLFSNCSWVGTDLFTIRGMDLSFLHYLTLCLIAQNLSIKATFSCAILKHSIVFLRRLWALSCRVQCLGKYAAPQCRPFPSQILISFLLLTFGCHMYDLNTYIWRTYWGSVGFRTRQRGGPAKGGVLLSLNSSPPVRPCWPWRPPDW